MAPSLLRRLTRGAIEVPFIQGPCAPDVYLAQHSVVHRLQNGTSLDPDFVEQLTVFPASGLGA